MDLSQFPKPLQEAFEPLVSAIHELYRDYPDCLVTVLRKYLETYGKLVLVDQETQTVVKKRAVEGDDVDELFDGVQQKNETDRGLEGGRADEVESGSGKELLEFPVVRVPGDASAESTKAEMVVDEAYMGNQETLRAEVVSAPLRDTDETETPKEAATLRTNSERNDQLPKSVTSETQKPGGDKIEAAVGPEDAKTGRALQMKQYNKFRKLLKEKKSKEEKAAVPVEVVPVQELKRSSGNQGSESHSRTKGWAFEPSSFVYDRQSRNFYNAQHNCFYMADSQLYYFVETKAYYTYDQPAKCLIFYSSAAPQVIQVPGAESGPTPTTPSHEVVEEGTLHEDTVQEEEEEEDMEEGEVPDSPQPQAASPPDVTVESEANVWNLDSLAEDVRSAAQGILDQNFVYEPTSGTYYNALQQCYYYPDSKMYFYVQNNAYYLYDEKDKCLKFYYSADPPQDPSAAKSTSPATNVGKKSPREDLEEGEIDETEYENVLSPASLGSWTPVVISKEPTKNNPNVEPPEYVAPCIRLTVKNTTIEGIAQGQLYIITRSGGTLGRDDNNDIVLPDSHVDTLHVTFKYRFRKGKGVYTVVCVGSNDGASDSGTFLDEKVMKQHKPYQLKHESVLRLGDTKLSCHIHHGTETCEHCEPSCLGFTTEGPQPVVPGGSLKARHTLEINQIKRKFGINGNLPTPKLPKGYEDKSKIRRDTVGSSHDSEKTEVASTEEHIRSDNKGFAMMQKMGWKEGGAVGRSGEGLKSPVDVAVKSNRLGLGCSQAYVPQVKSSAKAAARNTTKKRYEACKWQVSSEKLEKDD